MLIKFHHLRILTVIVLLLVIISACVWAPTPVATPTAEPSAVPTLSPTDTIPPATETAVPTPSAEPTQDSTTEFVDLTTVKSFFSLVMFDTQTGWSVTDLGLLRTTDGGQHWQLTNPPVMNGEANPLGSFFLDASSAYLLSPGLDFSSGILYRTIDAGHTWTNTNVPFSMGAIQFLDSQQGFVMASQGAGAGSNPVVIYSTQDGGQNWQKLYSTLEQETPTQDSLGNGGIKSGQTFLDAQHGWITGSIPMENFTYLYASTDGGLTWILQPLPIPTGGMTSFYVTYPPVFFNTADGLLQTQQSPSDSSPIKVAIFATHDGGTTWQALPPIDGSGPISTPTAADWFFWNQSKLLVTHDGGMNWQEVPTNLQLSESPVILFFVDPTTGWEIHYTADSAFHFYTTSDGGQSWTPILP